MAKSTAKSTRTKTTGRSGKVKASAETKASSKRSTTETVARAESGAMPDPVLVEKISPTVVIPALRKKDLIEAVVSRTGVKRRFVKPAVEGVLAEIGEAIAVGRDLNLPGLGKVKLQRSKKMANSDVHLTRIRQPKPKVESVGEVGKDPLAESVE